MNPSFQEAMNRAKTADRFGLFSSANKIEDMQANIDAMSNLYGKILPGEDKAVIEAGKQWAEGVLKETNSVLMATEIVGFLFKLVLSGEKHANDRREEHESARRRLTPDVLRLAQMGEEPDDAMLAQMMECEQSRHFYRGVADAHNKTLLFLGGITMALAPLLKTEREKALYASKTQ